MSSKQTYDLSLEINESTLSLFPEAIGKEGAAFTNAVSQRVRSAFRHLSGVIKLLSVNERSVDISWEDDNQRPGPLGKIAGILTKGNYEDGILLLELFLSAEPENGDLLYNLGMAHSDQTNLDRAIQMLTRLVTLEPDNINGRIALGVAFIRNDETEKGVQELQVAASREPDNLWAQKNLGAGLMKLGRYSDALEHLRIATELSADDQQAWYGYGQALEMAGNIEDADRAYVRTIEIGDFNQLGELAQKARSNIARTAFREKTEGGVRMDAVMYCLGALEKFSAMSRDQVQKIGFEIAILGTRGLDVNNPNSRYTLKSLPGDFSGLHLLCYQFVAFKQIAPETNIGFDLLQEYRMALSLFENRSEKGT